ncbi:MAG: ABC transporter permease [Chthonomonas sp.]|nr:ABC transporter permease [Chthonomonas sp.]
MKNLNWRLIWLVLGTLAVICAVILLAGKSPIEVVERMIRGSLGTPRVRSETLKETTPLLIAGLGVFIALRAGLFNIGVEGQLVAGACTTAVIAYRVPGPMGIGLAIAAAIAVGVLAALLPALIRIYRGGHEVITTIMLNNIIIQITTALANGPLKAAGQDSSYTAKLADSSMLSPIFRSGPFVIHPSLILGLLMVIGFAVWMKKSIGGYELNAVGANRTAAEFAGISSKAVMLRAFLTSGALAGLAGALIVLSTEGRFYAGFSPGYGFDALGVALLAGPTALGLIPAALGFGLLTVSQSALIQIGISKGLTGVLLGCLIIVLAAFRYREIKKRG